MAKKDKIQHKKVKGREMVYKTISLPVSLIEDLKILKDVYEDVWTEGTEKERVTYEKIFERLLSKSGLGHVDPDVYAEYLAARESRKQFNEVVTRATRSVVSELSARAEKNGTSLKEEAKREQELAQERLEAMRGKTTQKRYVHPDGRWYRAVQGDHVPWVPVNEDGKWLPMSTVKDFTLQDVELP